MRKRGKIKKTGVLAASVLIVLLTAVNFIVVGMGGSKIAGGVHAGEVLSEADLGDLKDRQWDCILVLGAGLLPDGTPNNMLRDRLEVGIELYNRSAGGPLHTKLLLSGDNGQEGYDEVNAMKEYALKAGIPKEDMILDHAGFSTYESIYRAKEIFKAENVMIVTQKYHLYRALYIAESLGLSAAGVYSDQAVYRGQAMREIREVLARDKDFIKCIAAGGL